MKRTIAVRVCQQCRRIFGVFEWSGADALEDAPELGVYRDAGADFNFCVTHGVCSDACERLAGDLPEAM